MACQFNTSETAALDQLDEYVRDALDLIDFANGPVTSPWGKLRAEMGHPEPFHLTMIGVGNEQWGTRYIDRYKVFACLLYTSLIDQGKDRSGGSDSKSERNHRRGCKSRRLLQLP